jgi:hypothetical protein
MDQDAGKNANRRKARGTKGNLSFNISSREIVSVYVLG